MNICILIPSDEFKNSAGVRIRYLRIIESLDLFEYKLDISPIQDFKNTEQFTHDIYIISKCYDARALLVAFFLARSQKLVGIDLFDDYFSQTNDSRFSSLRYWFHTMLNLLDFIICSTPDMAKVVKNLAPGLATHIMNDPSPPIDSENILLSVQQKQNYVAKTKILDIGWFGIGDNPYFSVGLSDLVAFGRELAPLRGRGFNIHLSILTNQRAMTADTLASLRRLPVPYILEEWTEEREAALLAKCLVCFLPVKGQSFSTVKSLNRAVTTLSAGVQVLSSGYPLYESLSPFVYRDVEKLLKDINSNMLALRDETATELVHLLEKCANSNEEAKRLTNFFEMCYKKNDSTNSVIQKQKPLTAVIHGKNSSSQIHKFICGLGALSVASPICESSLNFDIRFTYKKNETGIEILISEKCCLMLRKELQSFLVPYKKILDTNYKKLDNSSPLYEMLPNKNTLVRMDSPMSFTAGYTNLLDNMGMQLKFLFPEIKYFYSEHTKLPWSYNLPSDNAWNSGVV